jgi:hypothetical protein
MAFIPISFLQSDPVAIALVPPTPVTLTAVFVASGVLDVRNFAEVDWNLLVTNGGADPVTQVNVQWEFAETAAPAATDWTPLQTEAIAAGVSTPSTYEMRQTVGAVPFTRSWTTKARGRWMRALVRGAVGDPTGSIIALTALRRING